MATHQVGKHKDPHIVVLLLIEIAETFSVDENNVDSFAIYINWYRLVVDPETLSAGNYFAADAKAVWLTDQMVENVRLASTVFTRDCNYRYWRLHSIQELDGSLVYHKLCSMFSFENLP